MNNLISQRYEKLLALAQTDENYLVWQNSYRQYQADFIRYADQQPEETRTMLYGYAECSRLIPQRLVNLACEVMAFPDE